MYFGILLCLLASLPIWSQPIPSYPANGATNVPTNTEFSWRPISADLYEIEVSLPGTDDAVQTLYSTSSTVKAHNLEYQTRYSWRVRGADSIGQATAWSEWLTFTTETAQNKTVLISPPDGSTDLEPPIQLQWEGMSASGTFEVQVSNDTSFSAPHSAIVSGTTYQVLAEPGVARYWRVR